MKSKKYDEAVSMNELMGIVMTIENYFFYAVVIAMPVFAAVSIVNRLRVKKVQLAVRHGLLWGYPLLPTIYGFVQLLCLVIAYAIGDEGPVIKFSFYLIASVFWFIGASASEQRLVLEDGILFSVNSQKKSLLRWERILDYFSKPKKNFIEYHFFYDDSGMKKKKCASRCKVVLRVQTDQKEQFEAIIKEKLEP
ncbi:MAG: hypothetical protein HGB11_12700, partial [Chlorobiales bacterium]|nr:hypothetical protein [Chlorobiales bacterium]